MTKKLLVPFLSLLALSAAGQPPHVPYSDQPILGKSPERALIMAIRAQALAMKRQGMPADAAGKEISATLKRQHPDWPETNASEFVKSVYIDPADSHELWRP